MNKPKLETQTQAAVKDEKKLVYIVLGVGVVAIVVLGIVIFVGLRMNRGK